MALHDRIETLRSRHAQLEEAVRIEIARPWPDEQQVNTLKRQKLRIKDMINSLTLH